MNNKLDQWLTFLDDENKGEIEMAEKKNEILKDAKIELGYLTGEEEVRRLAELRDKWESDWNSYMEWVRVDEREEGKKEIAKELLKLGINIEDIAKATKLTKEEIEKLK